jgi:Tfp pilus assembly protein PilF
MLKSQTHATSDAAEPFILFRPFVRAWRWLFPPSLAEMDRQSETTRLIAKVLIVVAFLGLSATVVIYGKTWYNMWQHFRSNQLVEEAKEYEKDRQFMKAYTTATKAYYLDPENPNAIRTLAGYYVQTKQKYSTYLLDKLKKLGQFTDEDLQLEIDALANLSDNKTAGVKIEESLRNSKPNRRVVEIADRVMRDLERKEQLLEILRVYVQRAPEDLDIKLTYALRRIELGNPIQKSEGMADVWQVAETKEKPGLEALEFLDEQNLTDPGEQRLLIALLERHPLAGEPHRIAAMKRTVALDPSRRKEIMDRAVSERLKAKREDLEPIARWLSTEGEYDRFFLLFNEDKVREYPPLLRHYLNVLMLQNKHDEMERLINDSRTRLQTYERALYTAHLAYIRGKSWDEVDELLVKALHSAEQYGRTELVVHIASYAEQRNHPLVAEKAYRIASSLRVRSEPMQRRAFDGLLKLTYRNGNSKGFMEACHEGAERWPENKEIREKSLYANLLAGMDLETTIASAQKLLTDTPDDSRLKLLAALGHFRMLNYDAAAHAMNQSNLSHLTPGQAAVLCGILTAAGKDAQAKAIAKQIPQGQMMLQEELRFLQLTEPGRLPPAVAEAPAPPPQL